MVELTQRMWCFVSAGPGNGGHWNFAGIQSHYEWKLKGIKYLDLITDLLSEWDFFNDTLWFY